LATCLPKSDASMTRNYFDYNATTPVRPEVADVMRELLAVPLNASSIHAEGRHARSLLETSRRVIAEYIGAFAVEVIFTASGTESNNWVLQAFADKPHVVSAIEHSSIYKAARNPIILPVTEDGVVDMARVEALLPTTPGFLVSVMLANNETGVIQPIADIAALVHAHGGLLHCDAAQGLGKISFDFNALGCDFMTLCAHKMGGAVGAAALVAKSNIALPPQALGGGQEFNRRAGTENVAAIAGFAEAVKLIDLEQMKSLGQWLTVFEQEAKKRGAVIAGEQAPRLPNTTCIAMPNMTSQTQMMLLDLEGVSVSAGAACTSGKAESSHVLTAMGLDDRLTDRAIRISGGWGTASADIEALTRVWQRLQK
jgi:cysteine desulfurase